MNNMPFKERLYNKYVSSGQAGKNTLSQLMDGGKLFGSYAPYITRLIDRHIPADRTIRIVDLGCGHGTYLYFFKRKGYQDIVGVDTSEEQVELAHRLGIKEVYHETIETFLSKDNKTADVVLLMDILEHLPTEEVFSLLDKVSVKLKVGGKIVIHVPNAEGIFGMRIRYGDLTHEQAFTPTSIRQMLQTVGFSHIICEEEKPVVHGFRSLIRRIIWTILTIPFRLLLMAETGNKKFILSQNILVVAKK